MCKLVHYHDLYGDTSELTLGEWQFSVFIDDGGLKTDGYDSWWLLVYNLYTGVAKEANLNESDIEPGCPV